MALLIIIALLVAGTVAYFIFKSKEKPTSSSEEPTDVGYESAPSITIEKPKKSRKPRTKRDEKV